MEQFVKHLSLVVLTVYILCSVTSADNTPASKPDLNSTIDRKEVTEGENLTVVCNVTAKQVYWLFNFVPVEYSKTLTLKNVTRNSSGLYTCTASNITILEPNAEPGLHKDIYIFYLDVLYPAKILSVNITSRTVFQHDNFHMRVKVEGDPPPVTTFKSLSDNTTWFTGEQEGILEITIPSMNCTDTGKYRLTCQNDLGNQSRTEDLSVLCPPEPDPNFPLNKTFKPRLGKSVEITVHVVGYPAPTYYWSHNGTELFNHTDTDNTTVLNLANIAVEDFGQYNLLMKNDGGNYSLQFDIQADGPPEPVTNLSVSGVTASSVNLSFFTGFDYNDRQTFYIMKMLDGNLTDFKRKVMDSADDNGGRRFSVVVVNLTESTGYSLTVLSGNSRANASSTPKPVTFSTFGKPKPDPRYPLTTSYKPRLGDNVTLTIHASGYPVPKYFWSHDGKEVNSTDYDYNSTVIISDVAFENFGTYTLNISNHLGSDIVQYKLLADGPPEPVSSLEVSDINETCAHLSFITGYNYNSTQTFLIERYTRGQITVLQNCTDLTSGRGGENFTCILCSLLEDTLYNVTVVSKNSRGESPTVPDPVNFSTYGKPKPDPDRTVNSTFKPRLAESVTLTMHAIGYPAPKYQWLHNGKQINSTDTDYSSHVYIEGVTVADFGKYVLNMKNVAGNFTKVYEILAEGPPAPVTNISLSAVTTSSATLSFITGYDYNKTQTFTVLRSDNGEMTGLKNVTDEFPDSGQKKFNVTLVTLASNTVYNVTVVSTNSNGTSGPVSSDFVTFTTEGIPSPDPAHHTVNTTSPRLGMQVIFKMYAVGNPQPVFSWRHGNNYLNHSDDGLTTMIKIPSVTPDDFGLYVLNMKNKIGSTNFTFHLNKDGPPDAVTQLNATNVTANTVHLHWKAGFDYGSNQTFKVKGSVNNKEFTYAGEIPDTSGGKGGMESTTLEKLQSSSTYNIYIVANNARGEANKSNTISFTTSAGSGKSKTTTAEYIGYVSGGVGVVILIIVIIAIIFRCRRTGNESSYTTLQEDEEEENIPHKPHHYRYDDAAAPSGL